MTLADDIGHVLAIAHSRVGTFAFGMNFDSGLLDRMEDLAKRGGYITEDTTEAWLLASDAAELRRIADELMKRRAALLDNQPQPLKQAAE